jgi:GntR family transcriptional regulator / MocR family aminotransferase
MSPTATFNIALPPRGSRRRQHAIHAYLRSAVIDGRLKAGVRLPASRVLAESLGVARITVVSAYDMLVAEGYFVVRRGAGTFVATLPLASATRTVQSADAIQQPLLGPLARPRIKWTYSSAHPRPVIDFTVGTPDLRQFRFDVWNRFAARAMRMYCRRGESYGDVRGSSRLRNAIAGHVSFARAVAASDDTIVVTSGAQQAMTLLAQLFVTPGKTTVAIEDPGYPPAFEAFAASGAKMVSVPVDSEGIRVDRIPRNTKIIYVTPSHQFPLGVVLSPQRRAALLSFAATHNAVIVEDDYDSEFRFCGRPLDALQTMDRHQRVFYVGTFSKSLFPSLRIGFIVAPPWAIEALIAAKHRADWHTHLIAQEALASFIAEGHLLRHVRRMHKVYAARRELLLTTLAKDLSPWLCAIASEAGLHVTVNTASRLSSARVVQTARAKNVGIYMVRANEADAKSPSSIVFGFGQTDETDIAKGLAQLRRALSTAEFSKVTR